jgi:hypothetical protein
MATIEIAKSAEDNGLANMLATMMRQNLEDHPERELVLGGLEGSLAIFAEDAEVAITWVFERGGRATVHDGIVGIPDLTIRGGFEQIGDMSRMENMPGRLHHFPDPRGDVNRAMARAVREGKLRVWGLPRGLPLLLAFGELMQIA